MAPHRCEWCHVERTALDAMEDDYTRQIIEADAEADRLGGSLRCKPDDKARVAELGARAAGMEEDRNAIRICLRDRP